MIIEGVLLLSMWPFHHKTPKQPQHNAIVDQIVKTNMEVVVADGDIVARIEREGHNAKLNVEADLIKEAKADIFKCMNEPMLSKFEDDVADLDDVVNKLLAIDQDLRDEIVL